ncbi:MFS transporter [Sphingomonas flavalba]|uniref:MFS transporter n=1 Tax=Sphingomonas flavalba TaxID=2559804 RepID=UPI0039DF5437
MLNRQQSRAAAPPGGGSPKTALAAAAGAAIEWYDFFIYGTAAALVFPKLFFPADMPLFAAQIAAFSTFAVGFIARPVGGVLFGHFGDLLGRKKALATALVLMGLSTAAIGLLPSYASIGVAAPLLLALLRIVQGLAVGGQWGGAALLAIESAPPGRQGLYGSFVQIGVPLGVVLANGVFLVAGVTMSAADFAAWGWRIPFLLSLALVGIGFYVQFRLEDSEEFRAVEARTATAGVKPRSPIVKVLRSHPRQILLAGGAFVANNICFYVCITYAIAYGTTTLGLSKNLMLGSVMAASIIMAPFLIFCGWISDRWGRLPPFLLGAALTGVWAFAFFPLIETGSPWAVLLAITVELGFISLMYGPQAALFAELFPVELRYSGASLGYQLGSVVGGGFAPIIATALYAHFHASTAIAGYMFAACAVSFVCTALLRDQPLGRIGGAAQGEGR